MWVPFPRAAALVVGALSTALVASCTSANPGARPIARLYSPIGTSYAISRTNGQTAYSVVEQLRPTFLRSPLGPDTHPTVYLDGIPLGGVAELRGIQAQTLAQIQFLSATEAAGRYGWPGRSGRVILLTSRKFRP